MACTGVPCLLVCTLVAAASAARGTHKVVSSQGTAINPALAPESDKKFFGMDYPDDSRPEPSRMHLKKFDHPYPAVQDHETYDKDYVKDENADDGEWKAQMDYDRLRTKLRHQREAVDEAHKRAEEEGHLVDAAAAKEKSAHEKAEEAEREAEKARKAAKEAHDELEKLVGENAASGEKANGTSGSGSQGAKAGNGTTAGEGVGGEIGEAAGDVTNKIHVLEDCQRQLAEAKARLKAAMAMKELKAKEKAAVQAAKEAKEKKARSDYDAAISNTTAKHNGSQAEAQTEEEKLDSEEKRLEKAVAEAETAHRAALRAYKEEEELMEKEEDRLKEAADKLRHYRAQVDQDGGVTRVKQPSKSRGSRAAAMASLLGLTAVLTLA